MIVCFTKLPRISTVIAMSRNHSSSKPGPASNRPSAHADAPRCHRPALLLRAGGAVLLCAVLAACSGPGNFVPELAAIEDQTSVTGREIVTLKSLGTDLTTTF